MKESLKGKVIFCKKANNVADILEVEGSFMVWRSLESMAKDVPGGF